MRAITRGYDSVDGLLLRKGAVIARLTATNGVSRDGVPDLTGTLVGRPGFWVAAGVPIVVAWQVSNTQRNAAWLEADATIASVSNGTVHITGTGPCRPHRRTA